MKRYKVFVVGGGIYYAVFLRDYELVNNPKDADIVIFTGGEDVDPSLYNELRHPSTYSNIDRDKKELEAFKICAALDTKLVIGICRGAQFLCVANGGKLVQDVENHSITSTHPLIPTENTVDKKVYQITSTHHQMQYPYDMSPKDYEVLYVELGRSPIYEPCTKQEIEKLILQGEPEIVLYHKKGFPKCLAIQGHPEMMRSTSPTIEMINNLIDDIMLKEGEKKSRKKRLG
jgi:gamma-glutamyl-gamma-aminobutyrate hydrolase PuuD